MIVVCRWNEKTVEATGAEEGEVCCVVDDREKNSIHVFIGFLSSLESKSVHVFVETEMTLHFLIVCG